MQIIPTEHFEQCAVVAYCHALNIPVFATMNGAHIQSKNRFAAINRMKAAGMATGIPDLVIPVVNNSYSGLFIEMKRVKKSVTSDDQLHWMSILNANGYLSVICKGADSAIFTINEYMNDI